MSTLRVIVFAILAWMVPPLIAGALGWHGVWGSGSALVDDLIPIPVAGGALHVPSLVLLMVLVALGPQLSCWRCWPCRRWGRWWLGARSGLGTPSSAAAPR